MAAKNMGEDAIHPGYGFLSENSEFVRRCKENGIAFIGPDADVIDRMGNKSHARKTMMDAGVPVVPGTREPVYDAEVGKKLAKEIGYPVMIKASSGGGGKGMRVAENEDEFEFQFGMAQRESANAFGDDTMILNALCRIRAMLRFRSWRTPSEMWLLSETETVPCREITRS